MLMVDRISVVAMIVAVATGFTGGFMSKAMTSAVESDPSKPALESKMDMVERQIITKIREEEYTGHVFRDFKIIPIPAEGNPQAYVVHFSAAKDSDPDPAWWFHIMIYDQKLKLLTEAEVEPVTEGKQ